MTDFAKPSDIRKRVTVTNPATGLAYEIRPVSPLQLWKAGVFPQGAPGMTPDEINAILKQEKPEERSVRIAAMETVLLRSGVTSVQIVTEPVVDETTQIHEDDLARDRDFLLIEVMRISGLLAAVDQQEGAFRPAGESGDGEGAAAA